MGKFDFLSFIYAVLGTIGLIGFGVAFAQLSFLLFAICLTLTLGSLYLGFQRKKKRFNTGTA